MLRNYSIAGRLRFALENVRAEIRFPTLESGEILIGSSHAIFREARAQARIDSFSPA